MRADWARRLARRAFRRGWCSCLPATGSWRFYPRYDTSRPRSTSPIDPALAIEAPPGRRVGREAVTALETRVGTLDHSARYGRDRGSPRQPASRRTSFRSGRRAGALRHVGTLPPRRPPGGTAAPATVPARNTGSDGREPARDRNRAAADRVLGTVVGYSPRQRP